MLRKMNEIIRKALRKLKGGRIMTFLRNLKKKEPGFPLILSSLHSLNIISFFSRKTPCYARQQQYGRGRYYWLPSADNDYYYRNLRHTVRKYE